MMPPNSEVMGGPAASEAPLAGVRVERRVMPCVVPITLAQALPEASKLPLLWIKPAFGHHSLRGKIHHVIWFEFSDSG